MRLTWLSFLLFLLTYTPGYGQIDPCRMQVNDTIDYWVGFMESPDYSVRDNTNTYVIRVPEYNISSFSFVRNKIYIGGKSVSSASTVRGTAIGKDPHNEWQATGSENKQNKAIRIITSEPASVKARNASDATSIMPTEALGLEYYAMCYAPASYTEFLVVATEDSTQVTILPSATTFTGRPANVPISITLNRGEEYQVQSQPDHDNDLTGSFIKSTKRIAVFAGAHKASIPKAGFSSNHLYEEMPPVKRWGKKFIVTPLETRSLYYCRILASQNNTDVRVGNLSLPPLQKGQFHEIVETGPQVIESDNPVLVAQFSPSREADNAPDGAPFEIIISPVTETAQQWLYSPIEQKNPRNKAFINIVVEDSLIGKVKFFDSYNYSFTPPVSDYHPIGNSGYSFMQINITEKDRNVLWQWMIQSLVPGKGFMAYAYGFDEGYAYGFSMTLDLSNANTELKMDLGEKNKVLCEKGDPLILDAGTHFDHYSWKTGETTSVLKVSQEGTYVVTGSTNAGCIKTDSVKVVLSKPSIDLGKDLFVCDSTSVLLTAFSNDEFTSYTWSTGTSDSNQLRVNRSDDYTVTGITKDKCKASDVVKVAFNSPPRINATALDTVICGKKSAILNISADRGYYSLTRESDGFVSTNLEAIVPDWGTFPFKFTAVDNLGCSADTSLKISFRKNPEVGFSIDSTKCYHYNLDVKYLGDAEVTSSRFTWIFGGDTIASGYGLDTETIPLGINRSKRDLSLKVTYNGCSNADTIKDIKVIPNLELAVRDKLGCEPFNAEFTAHNTETVTYDWDYGDGKTERSSDHVFHSYPSSGYYPVGLKVTTPKGCFNRVSIDSMIHVAPVPTAGFSLDPTDCLDAGEHSVLYSGTGDLKDTYNWDLSAFDAAEIIRNPGITQSPFVFNLLNKPAASLGLQVVSKFGCKSKIETMLLKRRPVFTFSASAPKGCVPLETILSAHPGDAVDQIRYTWDFGDAATADGREVTHLYDKPDSYYNVTLTGKSELTGCSFSISKDSAIIVHPVPDAAFTLDHSIVYNDKPEVKFENQSNGSISYLWDFGDGSTSVLENPVNQFKGHGYKKVILHAYNEFLCADTVSHEVLVAFNRIFPPNAFSPNAPNITDREFKLGQEAIMEEGYHLVIFSRWNDIVFEARNEIKGWDGRLKNGEYAPGGNYVWILEFKDFLNRKHRQTGTVTLIY